MTIRFALISAGLVGVWGAFADAQSAFTVDLSQRRQTIQGLGVTATGTWIPKVVELYEQESFAKEIGDDLGASIIRLALPPAFQSEPDLDTETLDLTKFDAGKFSPPASFVARIYKDHPELKVMLTVWSPPAWMKDNNSTVNGGHLRADRREHFAKYCAAACLAFERTYGVPVYGLSVQNEPVFVQKYDSCVYTPEEVRETVKAVRRALAKWSVRTRIMAPEDVNDTPRMMKFVDAICADDGSLDAVSIIDGHGSPSTGWTDLHAKLSPLNKEVWMTETSGESPDWAGAMKVAKEIHEALVLGECSAWVYWAISDPEPDEFALMSLSTMTPKYAAAKQYFRFIRPGAVRVEATPVGKEVLVSAFLDEGLRQVTIVAVNSGVARDVTITVKGMPEGVTIFDRVGSSGAANCKKEDGVPVVNKNQLTTNLPEDSITTLFAGYKQP